MKNYVLRHIGADVEEKLASSELKSLREEIAILRYLLENTINGCKNTIDLVIQQGPISDLILKIERLVSSCHKIEQSMGVLLDKAAVLQFASEVVNILSEELEDKSLLNRISDRILDAVRSND